jgi:hypothetical protein
LGGDLLRADLAELVLVVGNGGSEKRELAISPDPVLDGAADPAAERVGLSGVNSALASLDELGVDGHRETMLLRGHTLMVTEVR